jgi:hypothetical protein
MVQKGSTKLGPSKTYVRLLQGKITSQAYAQTLTRSVGASSKSS